MGLFGFLFGKKKKGTAPVDKTEETDGQEKYLIDKEPEEKPTPKAREPKKKPAPEVIPADKVRIEGARGRTLKDVVKSGYITKKSSNTVIQKIGGVIINEEPIYKPAPAKEAVPTPEETPVKSAAKAEKAEKAQNKKVKQNPAPKSTSKPETTPAKKAPKKTAEPPVAQEENTEDGEVLESKATRSGKFELKKAKDGRFFFNLYASNHSVIAFSQIYSSSSAALTGIKSVMSNAGIANIEDTTLKNPTATLFPKWEIYIDKANQYRFRLYAGNGNCVCHASHGYATKSGCKGGIDSIVRFASEAKIDKKYLTK